MTIRAIRRMERSAGPEIEVESESVESFNSERPCWNDDFNIIGTWEQVDQTFSAYITGGAIRRKLKECLH